MWLSSLHPACLACVFLLLLPSLFLVLVRLVVKHRPRTRFFFSWSASSAGWLFYIYEVKCVGLLWDLPKLISWWENLVLVCGSAASLLLYRRLVRAGPRRESGAGGRACRVCGEAGPGRDHHCVWLDLCITQSNMTTFLGFLCVTAGIACHLSLLLASTACPGRQLGPLLLPALPCWPDSHNSRLLLAAAAYSATVATLLSILLAGQAVRQIRLARYKPKPQS